MRERGDAECSGFEAADALTLYKRLDMDRSARRQYNVLQKGGDDNMAFSIRLTDEEKALAESYAKLHAVSLGEAFKRALFERIEDEYDLTAAEEAYKDYIDSGCKATPAADFWRELDAEV
ncbi:hypothetical protein GCWU000341_00613 [Oribacterium sp. oral taxon 078 str. F0262]|nr:hypothetical protein GCWU000341_00613 [Oribacterium sp. oral taxon 078 str. F0262]